MLDLLDWKALAAILASLFSIVSFAPYIRQILRRQCQPHAYTWLIWCITVSIAAAGVWFGGGGLVLTLAMIVNVVLVAGVFLLSLWYGSRNITRGDLVILLLSFGAIYVWLGLDSPVLAVMLATGIDLLGYAPTYRKSFVEPWSEDLLTWIGFALAPAFALIALEAYNLLTATYAAAVLVANIGLVALLLLRRRAIQSRTPTPAANS